MRPDTAGDYVGRSVAIFELATPNSRLLVRVAQGEDVVIGGKRRLDTGHPLSRGVQIGAQRGSLGTRNRGPTLAVSGRRLP